eukprot:CCRYP_010906-RA/>CCRYP_010906-RA protein AED:0.49 eAED:0.49 QI:41/1/1/1/0/0/3/71/40
MTDGIELSNRVSLSLAFQRGCMSTHKSAVSSTNSSQACQK